MTVRSTRSGLVLPPAQETYNAENESQTRRAIQDTITQLSAALGQSLPWVTVQARTADDTFRIQGAIDEMAADVPTNAGGSVSGGGIVLLPSELYIASGLVLKYGVHVVGLGQRLTTIRPPVASTTSAVWLLDDGVVAYSSIRSMQVVGRSIAGQHGIYFKASPVMQDGVVQGGWWYSSFNDLHVEGFAGEQVWLRGGGDALNAPHQWITFAGVDVTTDSLTKRALRLSGQVGQMGCDDRCQFDGRGSGSARLNGTENVLIERTVDDAGVNNGDIAPYSISFRGSTIQSNNRGVRIERAFQVAFLNAHFEELKEGVSASTSSNTTIVRDCYFANVGYALAWSAATAYGVGDHVSSGGVTYRCILAHTNHVPPNVTYWVVEATGTTAFCAKVSGGDATVMYCDGNEFRGTTTTHFVREFTSQIRIGRNYHENDVIRTVGVTVAAMAAAATIDTKGALNVWVNASATVITTITSELAPEQTLTIRANGGVIRLGTGGNIDLGGYRTPLHVPADGSVTLTRTDLSGTWFVANRGAPNSTRPGCSFVSANGNVDATAGSEFVDATAGPITRTLPAAPNVSPGTRVTVKKYDGSTNAVTIGGNPDGITPTLATGNDFMDFEWDGAAWKIVAAGNPSLVSGGGSASAADSKAVSAGTRASTADSKAVSGSTVTSTLQSTSDSKNTSQSVLISNHESRMVSHSI